MADSWNVNWTGDVGTTCTCSKTNLGEQRIDITAPSGVSDQLCQFRQVNRNTGWTEGTSYRLYMDVTPLTSDGVYAFACRLQSDQATDYNAYDMWTSTSLFNNNFFDFTPMKRGILESPTVTPGDTPVDLSFYFYCGLDATSAAASASVIIHEVKLVEI